MILVRFRGMVTAILILRHCLRQCIDSGFGIIEEHVGLNEEISEDEAQQENFCQVQWLILLRGLRDQIPPDECLHPSYSFKGKMLIATELHFKVPSYFC